MDRLWRYNLHYFDDLNAMSAAKRMHSHRALIRRWIAENPAGHGSGWEPYPASLRIVNWIKWFLSAGEALDVVESGWLDSLAAQTRWLCGRLEWHLLGNHLFVNAKALVMAGLYFDGIEAQTWLVRGLSILDRELPEQILTDGGQFERSPMYHALALEDLLDLLNLIGAMAPVDSPARALTPRLRATAARMLFWLRCMTHPDGRLGHFNDSADGIAPDNTELERYAAALSVAAPQPPTGLTHLADSGYIRASNGGATMLVDVAPIGPDYLVGHAHADSLAFELSLHGRRVVVNGGTSCYGLSAQRLRERGTAWHSTVQIGDFDSSEVWSGFRVGRRARITQRQLQDNSAMAAHDGWRHLPGAPLHRRTWSLAADALVVDDRLDPPPVDGTAAVARFHLAPGLALVPAGRPGCWAVTADGCTLAQIEVEVGEGSVVESLHAPRFGVLQAAQALAVTLRDGQARTRWHWSPDAHPLPH